LPASPQFMCGNGLPFSQSDRKNQFCILAKDIMQYTKQFFCIKCLININVRHRKPKRSSRMENPERQATLDIRHRTMTSETK